MDMYAPDVSQMHVINHLKGEPVTQESRQVKHLHATLNIMLALSAMRSSNGFINVQSDQTLLVIIIT